MTEEERRIRFGTGEPPAPARDVTLGPLSFRLEGGNLRRLAWRGTEAVRGLSAPLRDAAWGTWPEEDATEEVEEGPGQFRLRRRFTAADGALEGTLEILALAEGRVEASLHLAARRDLAVSRVGFCLLHPLQGVAGQALRVRHPDGLDEETAFPLAISPGQPVVGIAGLSHRIGPLAVAIAFEGEVFEMEDQRNWSDASYKTYCRPLSLPFPYRLAAGETVAQRIVVTLSDAQPDAQPDTQTDIQPDASPDSLPAAPPGSASAPETSARMPDLLLAAEPGWLAPDDLAPEAPFPADGLLLRLHAAQADDATLTAACRTLAQGGTLDLEAVLPDGADPLAALESLARALAAKGLHPRHVAALPEAYLQSHQPAGPWPGEPSPEAVAAAAALAFPEARIGVGMLTNFTELNRRPAPEGVGHYVTHGNSAIVHAADEASVLETLEALPMILADATRIAGARGLRLGLLSIGMRSNPYGGTLSPNPDRARRTMTAEDPRQDGLLAAAYAIAAAAIAARAGAEAVALAAPAGPFGLLAPDGAARPILHALAALHGLAGRPVRPDPVAGLRGLAWDEGAVLANPSLAPVTVEPPFPTGAVLSPDTALAARDPAWLRSAAGPLPSSLTLGPCDCLFLGVAAGSQT